MPVLTTNPVLVGLALAGAGAGAAVWVVVASMRQRLTPDHLLGRTYSASRLISWGVLPLGAAAAGIAAEFVGIRTVFPVGALVSVVPLVLSSSWCLGRTWSPRPAEIAQAASGKGLDVGVGPRVQSGHGHAFLGA